MADHVSLAPIDEEELPRLLPLLSDPAAPGEYQWFGYQVARARELERRFHRDGLLGADEPALAVRVDDGGCAGWVTWRAVGRFGNYEIGIALFPEHRGHGIGTTAQRLLVEHLFATPC